MFFQVKKRNLLESTIETFQSLKDIVRVWPTNEIFENIFASLNFLNNTPDRYHVNMKKYLWNQVFQILTSIFSYDVLARCWWPQYDSHEFRPNYGKIGFSEKSRISRRTCPVSRI